MRAEIETYQECCCYRGCGIIFWLSREHQRELISSKAIFFCPNGHSQSYSGESDAHKARRLQQELEKVIREKNLEIEQIKIECAKKKRKQKKI